MFKRQLYVVCRISYFRFINHDVGIRHAYMAYIISSNFYRFKHSKVLNMIAATEPYSILRVHLGTYNTLF